MTIFIVHMFAQLFSQPMRVPTDVVSLLWVVPICLSIALVYKTIKIEIFTPALLLREVAFLFVTIIGFLILVALALLGIARLVGI
jgi:hypothetical protein